MPLPPPREKLPKIGTIPEARLKPKARLPFVTATRPNRLLPWPGLKLCVCGRVRFDSYGPMLTHIGQRVLPSISTFGAFRLRSEVVPCPEHQEPSTRW